MLATAAKKQTDVDQGVAGGGCFTDEC